MDQSTPGPPVCHCLPELGQIRVGRFDDTVHPSPPLSSPSPLALTLSQHQGLFQGVFSNSGLPARRTGTPATLTLGEAD